MDRAVSLRPVRNRRTGELNKTILGGGIYKMVKAY